VNREHSKKSLSAVALLLAICAIMVAGCEYGRMYDQDVVKTYGRKMKTMDKRTVPVSDGFEALLRNDPKNLRNPLSASKESTDRGRLAYGYFCVQCHGPGLDGRGTVGQSFAPLPANLTSPAMMSASDGELYAKVRLGFKRHPRLFPTISEDDTWAVLIFIRSEAGRRS
jgi:mono/diheme cytochrome c family protein